MEATEVKKVLDFLIDYKKIEELIINLHSGARDIYVSFSAENPIDFYAHINNSFKEKMAKAIADSLNN